MRTATSELDLRRAASLDEALSILRDEPRTPVAGATDVYVALNFGTTPVRRFLDLWALDELRDITTRDGTLVLGALATYTALIRSSVVRERLPMLVEASRLVGGVQIQNRGTVGGNLANASPAGDSLPVLAAAEAPEASACSVSRARTTVGATLPNANRGSAPRTPATTTFEIACAARVPTLRNHCAPSRRGTSTATISSSGRSTVAR